VQIDADVAATIRAEETGVHAGVADITKGPIPDIADNSAIVFVSCVLEYVADIDAALREISSVSGRFIPVISSRGRSGVLEAG
jgi:hypothetical protein